MKLTGGIWIKLIVRVTIVDSAEVGSEIIVNVFTILYQLVQPGNEIDP